jgi:two-component sensor histidine kinase
MSHIEPSAAGADSRDKLLREMNHRLQNNIQWLALLLEFQPANTPVEASRLLNGVAARLRSLSGVFALRAESAGGIVDAGTLISGIVRNAEQALGLSIDYDPDSAGGRSARQWQVTESMIFAASLLLGEIVSNAIRHRTGIAPPRMNIQQSGSTIKVDVSNAAAAPANFETIWQRGSGVGLDLARTVTQMQGGLELALQAGGGLITATVTLSPPALEPFGTLPAQKHETRQA